MGVFLRISVREGPTLSLTRHGLSLPLSSACRQLRWPLGELLEGQHRRERAMASIQFMAPDLLREFRFLNAQEMV